MAEAIELARRVHGELRSLRAGQKIGAWETLAQRLRELAGELAPLEALLRQPSRDPLTAGVRDLVAGSRRELARLQAALEQEAAIRLEHWGAGREAESYDARPGVAAAGRQRKEGCGPYLVRQTG